MTVAPATSSPGCFSTGTDSPVSSDWSTALRALLDDAVGGDLLAGADDEAVADGELLDRDAPLAAVGVEDGDVLGAELQQRRQRGAGAALGARLEVAAGEDERRHGGADLEVDLVRAAAGASGIRSNAIRMPGMPASPRNSAYSDQPPRGEHADRDQRVHRRGAVPEVRPRGAVERPRAPHDDRRGELQRQPLPVVELQRRDHRHQPAPAASAARETSSRRRSGAVSSAPRRVSRRRLGGRQDRLVAGGLDGRRRAARARRAAGSKSTVAFSVA